MKFFEKLLEKALIAFIPVTIWVRENPEKENELIKNKMEKTL